MTFGRYSYAMSQLPHIRSDWLQSHNSELMMCETAESEERGGYVRYLVSAQSTYLMGLLKTS